MPETTLLAGNVADITFKAGELSAEDLRVAQLEGREALSELFEFKLSLLSDQLNLPLDDVVGKPATLRLIGRQGERYVNGIVRNFERTGDGVNQAGYSAELVPVHWLLTRRYACRTFQAHNCEDMSVPGIVRKVMADAGIPAERLRWALQDESAYTPRDYVVQYRETDFAFISRLLEEEGLFYFFEHTADSHRMVIGDHPSANPVNPGKDRFLFRSLENSESEELEDIAFFVSGTKKIHFGAVCLDDFNFEDPERDLSTQLAGTEYTSLEWSNYPDNFQSRAAGQRYARLRLEEQVCQTRQFTMQTHCRLLQVGHRITIAEHPTFPEFNREYLITALSHSAVQTQSAGNEAPSDQGFSYRPAPVMIPAETPYRPPCRTPRPQVHGTQTAIVVGPEGEELYTDKYGRVKVQFHWDRAGAYDENSSCWVRVSQGMAGGGYGLLFLPRIGQEVVIAYEEGNPDRPLIVGRVYNADHMPGYSLPDHKTRSTIKTRSSKGGAGGNEIRFEDQKDNEQLLIHAMRDFHLRTKRDRIETVERDEHVLVQRNVHRKVKQSEHLEIVLDHKVKIGGKVLVEVAGDIGQKIGGKVSWDASGDIYLKSGGKLILEAGSGITLKCGGNFVKVDSSGVTILGTKVKINSGGSADSGTLVPIAAPEPPLEAEEIEYGQDKRYSLAAQAADAAGSAATSAPPPEQTRPPKTWIEIEMVDEAGQPWPNEPYEIIDAEGKKHTGALDAQGQAHIELENPGMCQICFPRLDKDAWERLG